MTATQTAALRVETLDRVFDVSAPFLSRLLYRQERRYLHAVNDVSVSVPSGGCLSLVGESGCDKSTVARLITGIYPPKSGQIRFAPGRSGQPLSAQMIFQDTYASLNPRWRVKNILAEPYLHRIVEHAETEVVFADPKHPCTRLLLETIPDVNSPHRDRKIVAGEVPSPLCPPSGCTFHPRYPLAQDRCKIERPSQEARPEGARVACHFA